jgi:hypothetical protein
MAPFIFGFFRPLQKWQDSVDGRRAPALPQPAPPHPATRLYRPYRQQAENAVCADPDPRSMPLTNGSGSCDFSHWPSRHFLKIHSHHFSKTKSPKKSQNSRKQGFSYYFCLMIEGSGSGSMPLTDGSGYGSGRPKNIWIQIRNTTRASSLSKIAALPSSRLRKI